MDLISIVKNMVAFHNNELLDWDMLLYQNLNNKTREDIIRYVEESISELQNYLIIFRGENENTNKN